MENKTFDFKKYEGTLLKLIKVEDRKFYNDHPSGYNVGSEITGILHLELSNLYQCLFIIREKTLYWHTSQVLEIWEHEGYDHVKTLNSTYRIEPQVITLANK